MTYTFNEPDVCLEDGSELLDGLVVLQHLYVLTRLVDDVVPHLANTRFHHQDFDPESDRRSAA